MFLFQHGFVAFFHLTQSSNKYVIVFFFYKQADLNDWLEETVRIKQSKGTNDTAFLLPEVPKNISAMPKPDKNEAIKSICTDLT